MKTKKRFAGRLAITFFMSLALPLMGADLESPDFFDRLLTLPKTAGPHIFEDAVIFTASSGYRRVGVALAAEGFAQVHWMRQLLLVQDPQDAPIPPGKKVPDPYKDSGLLFYVYQAPEGLEEIEYRLVIDGLWTTDPANPRSRRNEVSGISTSLVTLPRVEKNLVLHENPKGVLRFSFEGPSGELVTVAGSFNSWDPFMYELQEYPEGIYTLSLPLPPGTYQYLFFHRGERFLDPYNFRRAYTRDGNIASEVIIE
ncbi:MAG: glycogen-binding domain-containing protein [Treponema sp.]|jgi:hypothetical protein|nr:glycogen-binding domain-containing protein [Treponema sp.]